jgi:hypothetical protein
MCPQFYFCSIFTGESIDLLYIKTEVLFDDPKPFVIILENNEELMCSKKYG